MKSLQRLAGLSILLILVSMAAAPVQFYNEGEKEPILHGVEYLLNEGYAM